MKRNYPAKRRDRKTGASPWVTYSKTRFEYSETLRQWQAAVKRGDKAGAEKLARQHSKKFMGWAPAEVAA